MTSNFLLMSHVQGTESAPQISTDFDLKAMSGKKLIELAAASAFSRDEAIASIAGGLLPDELMEEDSTRTAHAKSLHDLRLEHAKIRQKKAATPEELAHLEEQISLKEQESHFCRVTHSSAHPFLTSTSPLLKKFLSDAPCEAFVISIDIRKSTHLMLKARTPKQFAQFLKSLCGSLYDIVIENFGVFDKFTGDGILAIFPDFYSGADAAFRALLTAEQAHSVFQKHYTDHRHCFTSVLSEVGLGIGIDAGLVHLVPLWGGFTAVGAPVVYACRLSAAPAGSTYVNQPAFEQVQAAYGSAFRYAEQVLEIKGEGKTLVYDIQTSVSTRLLSPPPWK
jgi:class 3 adenylate cyclase